MNTFIKWILSALLIMIVGAVIPGITVSGFFGAMFGVIMIALVNIVIRPILEFISIPLNYLTLGLFSLVINTVLFITAAKLSPGIQIDGFWSAFTGALILSIFLPLIEKAKMTNET